MAIVERVEAQLVADAGQFVQGITRAQAALGQLIPATQRLQSQLDRVTADFAAGKISGEQYGAAMVRIQGQLGVANTAIKAAEQRVELLTASLLEGKITAQQFGVQMNQIRAGLGTGLPVATQTATVGMKRLENVLTSVAFSALPGMSGAVGRVANVLTSATAATLGFGKAMLALSGIMAGVAIGFQRAKKEEQEFFDALQMGTERRQRHLDVIGGMGPEGAGALQARRAQLMAQLQRLEQGRGVEAMLGAPEPDAMRQLRQEISAIDAALERINAKLAPQRAELLATAAAWDAYIARLIQANNQARLSRDLAGSQARLTAAGAGGIGIRTGALNEAMRPAPEMDVQAQLDRIIYDPAREAAGELEQLGRNAGQALVTGLMMGIESMEDVWKLMLSVFTNTIIGALTQGLWIVSPSRLTMRMGEQLGQGLIVGMHATQAAVNAAALDLAPVGALGTVGAQSTRALGDLSLRASLDVSGVMGAPVNPFAAARDAEWQRLFRESALVAKSQGARLT